MLCRVLVLRGWRTCKHVCCKAGLVKEKDSDKDPLEEMYCNTLKYRMSSDMIVASLVFILVSALSLSTGFCRSSVSHTFALSLHSNICLDSILFLAKQNVTEGCCAFIIITHVNYSCLILVEKLMVGKNIAFLNVD